MLTCITIGLLLVIMVWVLRVRNIVARERQYQSNMLRLNCRQREIEERERQWMLRHNSNS